MATGISKTKWDKTTLKEQFQEVTVSLSYAGKQSKREILQTSPGKFTPLYKGATSANRLYFGDNLPALATLLRDPKISGKVRLIYIDPPFATGNIFKSRSQQDAYTDLLAGGQYIEFLRQRLILLRELLADDGSIYLHLDSKMAFYAKIIMDEVFGERNFRNWITRKKSNPKNYTRKTYGNISDFILFHTKSDKYVWHRPYDAWTESQIKKEYQYVEEQTGRRYKKVPIHAPGTRNGATGQPWRGMLPPPGKHWQYTPDKLEKMDARGEIYWSPNGNPRRKIYLDNSPGKSVQDIWLNFRDAHNQNIKVTGYPTEKNPQLLKRIIQASSNPGDLVLDCFSGSGTTLAVADQLGRKWIGIDNSAHAIGTTLKRFAIGAQLMGDFVTKKHPPKNGPSSQQTLFDLTELAQNKEDRTREKTVSIENFSLLASPDRTGELTEAMNKWRKFLRNVGE